MSKSQCLLLSQKECECEHSISMFFLFILRFKFTSIFSSLSHNLTRKLIFYQGEWGRHQMWWLLLLMLSDVVSDAFKLHFWCFTTRSKHPKCWNWKNEYSVMSHSNLDKICYTLSINLTALSRKYVNPVLRLTQPLYVYI